MTQHPPEKMKTEDVLRVELDTFRSEHRELDKEIKTLEESGGDAFTIQRLKRQKLALKDRIKAIEDRITPDIIA